LLPARNSQTTCDLLLSYQGCRDRFDKAIRNTAIWTKVAMMSRLTTLRITTDGRLLGFDTGDWSMLLGGFVLAGLLALLV
jgi:hypothetical protein